MICMIAQKEYSQCFKAFLNQIVALSALKYLELIYDTRCLLVFAEYQAFTECGIYLLKEPPTPKTHFW